jgi:NADH-quinone oxidoreductase subunit A
VSPYLPLALYFGVAAALGGAILTLSGLIGRGRASAVKLSPYECGMEPVGDARVRYSVHFYLVAVLFIVFDIEVVFLYPWALILRWLGPFGLVEMTVFIAVLLLGLLYAWRKGAFDWA